MLTKNDIHYLEVMFKHLKLLKYTSGCCGKKRKNLLKETLEKIFIRIGIYNDFKNDFEVSIKTLEKFIIQQKFPSIEDRRRILTILKSLKGE